MLSTPTFVRVALSAAVLSWLPALPAAAAQVTTSGSFSSFSGDVDPVSGPGQGVFEVFVNDVRVSPTTQVVGDYFQGTLSLAPNTTAVEFKSRQISLPFNTPNLIAFAPATTTAPTDPSQPFLLGTLTLTNGVWFAQASTVLTVTTSSSDAQFNARSFTDTLRYTVTPNTGTDEQNADYLTFDGHPELGQLRVYEAASSFGNSGSVQLFGRVGSLIPVYFANPSGAVFIQAVPEPETWLLLGCGVAVVGAAARRRRVRST